MAEALKIRVGYLLTELFAHTLGISRAAIYRHISNMNEKTATKARMGLIQFYYGWNPEK